MTDLQHIQKHWTDKERELLGTIQEFEEMADIALAVLKRMHDMTGNKIVQICGPMSTGGFGDLCRNMTYFRKTVRIAVKNGLLVFDQSIFQEAMIRLATEKGYQGIEGKEYCWPILDVFYARVFESGLIHHTLFLPTWPTSIGAKWEREKAARHGLVIAEYPETWLKEVEVLSD